MLEASQIESDFPRCENPHCRRPAALGPILEKGNAGKRLHRDLGAELRGRRDTLCESGYDVIVLDLGLPDGDGFEFCVNGAAVDSTSRY